jgi:GT2 family glycosyltransferase
MEQNKYTALVILNYNNYEDTFNCIESIEKHNTSPIKIIIVDNGSTRQGTVEAIDKYLRTKYTNKYKHIRDTEQLLSLPYITFVESVTNDGYATGNNKGLKYAYKDSEVRHILVLNNDILFLEDMIDKLIGIHSQMPQCAIVSPVLYKKDLESYDLACARLSHTNWEIILMFLFQFRNIFGLMAKFERRRCLLQNTSNNQSPFPIELPSGSCMLFEKSLMNKIKIFDPYTFLYFEENILFKQIFRVGMKNYIVPDLKCVHLGASSTNNCSNAFVGINLLRSADYYLHIYSDMSNLQKIVWCIAKAIIIIKYKIKSL